MIKKAAKFDGEKVKKLRLDANLTQSELAEIIGVPQPQISRFEIGQEPRFPTLKKLAKALEVDESELFYYKAQQ